MPLYSILWKSLREHLETLAKEQEKKLVCRYCGVKSSNDNSNKCINCGADYAGN